MKKFKVCFQTTAMLLPLAMLLAGCGSTANDAASHPVQSNTSGMPATMAAGGASYEEGVMEESSFIDSAADMDNTAVPGEEVQGTNAVLSQDRKLIRTVDLEMETKEFDRMMTDLEAQVQDLGGYIENMETYNGSSYTEYRSLRWANLTIRIPKEALNGFLKNMSEIGNVVRRSDSVEDVTLSYVDMESRRDTLRAEQERLLKLLEQASNVEEMIALEERLSNVRYLLESMESKLRTIDNQVDYSTVNLELSEVKELTPVAEKSDLQRITDGFADSIKEIGNGIKEGIIWFAIHIPYLVIWAAVIAAAVLFLRRLRKKTAAKKAAKTEQKDFTKSLTTNLKNENI